MKTVYIAAHFCSGKLCCLLQVSFRLTVLFAVCLVQENHIVCCRYWSEKQCSLLQFFFRKAMFFCCRTCSESSADFFLQILFRKAILFAAEPV